MFRASKLCQSSSTSGPSAIAVPEPDEDVLELPLHLGDEVQVTAVPSVAADVRSRRSRSADAAASTDRERVAARLATSSAIAAR